MLTDTKGIWFLCSTCEDIYRMSPSSGLEKLTVDLVSDLSSYPEVVVDPDPPFCDCRLRDYLETMVYHMAPQYCHVHNVIALGGLYEQKDLEDIDVIVGVITHETLHWVLGKIIGEPASHWLDTETVSDFLKTCSR